MRQRIRIAVVVAGFVFCGGGIVFGQNQLAPRIQGKTWFNTAGYQKPGQEAMRGRAVAVFFWTVTDAGSEPLAHLLNEWRKKYHKEGFEVIAVHGQEYESLSAPSEVYKKIEILGLQYPVILDEGKSLRRAYHVDAWPTLILVDREGYIRAHFRGPVEIEQIHVMIRQMIEESPERRKIDREMLAEPDVLS
jgi:alkyl hydroperoxide reductase subunit AhpC